MDRRPAFNLALVYFVVISARTQPEALCSLLSIEDGWRDTRLGKNRWATENQPDKHRADLCWIVGVTTDGFRYE